MRKTWKFNYWDRLSYYNPNKKYFERGFKPRSYVLNDIYDFLKILHKERRYQSYKDRSNKIIWENVYKQLKLNKKG